MLCQIKVVESGDLLGDPVNEKGMKMERKKAGFDSAITIFIWNGSTVDPDALYRNEFNRAVDESVEREALDDES